MTGVCRTYSKTIGGKTGFTDEANRCLINVAKDNDLELISVVLGSENNGAGDYYAHSCNKKCRNNVLSALSSLRQLQNSSKVTYWGRIFPRTIL